MTHFDRGRSIGIAVDEWGVWHPEADSGLSQPNTLRDALAAAVVLDTFNRQAGVVTMANIAQTVNVLQCLIQTDGAAMWKTPTYHVFDLYRAHMGHNAVRADLQCERLEYVLDDKREHVVPISVSASHDPGAQELVLSITNLHLSDEVEVGVSLQGARATAGELRVLTSANADDVNSAQQPDKLCSVLAEVASGDEFVIRLAPKSIAVAVWQLDAQG